jgi:adenine-specific DNA-methyltransferase
VDVIYIDPPYNTGAKDWKYNNNFVDEKDPYRHSKWLSMMSIRLKLAKNLLSHRGVLVCTIDENEHATLGLLLRELFPDYEIVCVTIIHNPGGIQGKNFSYTHEYAYFVHPAKGTYISTIRRDDVPPTPLRDWGKETSKREAAKNCFYPIYVKDMKIIGFGDICPNDFHPKKSNKVRKNGIIEVYPLDGNDIERKWRFSRKTIEGIADELICREVKGEHMIFREKKDYRWKTVWTDTIYNANVFGTKLLNNILKTDFPFPKSLYAVMDCIRAIIHDKDNSVILDFFAGSGTTGHAVLELNREDGGCRQFILVTNNENNIATDVCHPRLKKVLKGYAGLLDGKKYPKSRGNLKYYRTSFVPSEPSDENKELLTRQSVEMLCLRESTFDFVTETDVWKIFENNQHYTAILFDQLSIPDLKEELEKLDKPVSVYVFSLEDDNFANEFVDMKDKVKVCSIPEAILRVYRRIYQ